VGDVRALLPSASIDFSRIVLVGFSAGGQLALWAGAKHKLRVVALAPVADLERAAELRLNHGVVGELLGGSPHDVPERYEAASPVRLLPAGARHVLIHGTADDIVPEELSRRYVERAKQLGDDAQLISLEGADHFALLDPAGQHWTTIASAIGGAVTQRR
jgi:dipeptidyl aminopeptidase/acylaminoacyl peptidase